MFARVSTIQGSPDRIDAATRSFREQVLPTAEGLQGFKGGYLLVDRQTGKAVGITLWETERDMQESAETANQLRSQAAQAAGGPIASVEMYEIAVSPAMVRT